MNHPLLTLKTLPVACALLLMGASGAFAARSVSLPAYQGQPGTVVAIPVTIDNAEAIATAQIKVNFDPQMLEFVAVRKIGLGQTFELTHAAEDGVVTLILNRETSLASGSGRLAVLEFRVNAGAEAGTVTNLPVAECALCDDSGVKNLNLEQALAPIAGKITVTHGPVDNDGDQIPDQWELAQGLSSIDSNQATDSDSDGLNDFTEYAMGLNPKATEPAHQPKKGTVTVDGVEYLTFEFNRRRNANPHLRYVVEESSDLSNWVPVDTTANLHGSPVVLSEESERVVIRTNIPMNGQNARSRGFVRLRVLP